MGTWVNPNNGTIVFRSNTFLATGIPKYAMYDEMHPSNVLCSGKGRWRVKEDEITLDCTPLTSDKDGSIIESAYGAQMFITGKGDSMTILFVVGDPDEAEYYEFKKSSSISRD
ncbi:MAG: hypothetical protein ACYDBB_16150 [Armatimonadota bacterium]